MSHLSKIRTTIKDRDILIKSLEDLKILWHNQTNTKDFHIYGKDTVLSYNAILKWQDKNYELVADSHTWQEKNMLYSLLDKIQQRYAYNIILNTGKNEGFDKVEQKVLKHGVIRIVLEKWS